MINSKDVRIGNWFKNPATADAHQLTIEDISDIQYGHKRRVGIPLTSEILEKCGFEYSGRYAIGKTGHRLYRRDKIEFMQVAKR